MTYAEALDILADHPHAWRFRENCESSDPVIRDHWRAIVVRKASSPDRRAFPPLLTRLATAAGAVARVAVAVAAGEPVLADAAEASRRLAICDECEHYAPPTCRKCTCNMPLKARLATEAGQCPEGKW